MDETRTSEPGTGTDPLEADFEQQLAKEGIELEGRVLPKPEVPVVPPKPKEEPAAPIIPKEEKKPEVVPKVEDGKTKPELEPWRKMVAKKHEEKAQSVLDENDRLKKEIEELKKNPPAPSKPADQSTVTLSDEQTKLAEKYGIEPEDYLKMFPNKVIEKEVVKSGLSPEQEAMLSTMQNERQLSAISTGYDKEFRADVLPLIKAEYPNISDEKVEEIKSKIFEKIQTDAYSMTPLSTLYKGEDDFRGAVTVPKKTFDEGSKVPSANGNKVYDFENVTDADMKDASFPFEKYSDYMASKERGPKRN